VCFSKPSYIRATAFNDVEADCVIFYY